VVSPGDKVLIPSPYWTSYPDMVKMCSAEPVIVRTLAENQYQLTASQLETTLQAHPDISAIILCNPSNPTGCIATKEELDALIAVLLRYPDIAIVSDEIYERLVYDGLSHHSFAALHPDLYDRTITINGFSKSHAMTGYRLGYSASSPAISKAVSKVQSQITSCASSIGQYAATQALLHDEIESTWLPERLQELQAKRDLAYSMVTSIDKVTCPKPSGAFYLFPNIHAYFNHTYKHSESGATVVVRNSHDLAMGLLAVEGVALVAGEAFGDDDCIRISYATATTVIEESLSRLKRFLTSLQPVQ